MPVSPEVEEWFEDSDHPLKEVMQAVRSVILSDDRLSETIKWKSPTFMYQGNIASFNPRTKAHVSLMFHTGASIPGDHPILQGGGDTARYARFEDLEDVDSSRTALIAVIDAWCRSR
jgi:hypothetical protein